MQRNEKAAEIVNDLIKINNDRIEGYDRAIHEAKAEDKDLVNLFEDMKRESVKNSQELTGLSRGLGGAPESETTISGKIYRVWMDLKATLSGNSRKAILESCEAGEDAAARAYKTALSDTDLTPELRTVVSNQQQHLKESHDRIKELRNREK